MADKKWKRVERATAAMFGTDRNANNGQEQSDIDAGIPFAIEHKCWKTFSAKVEDAMAQAVKGAKPGKTPLLIVAHAKGQGRKIERYAIMRCDDFVDWFGQLPQSPETAPAAPTGAVEVGSRNVD